MLLLRFPARFFLGKETKNPVLFSIRQGLALLLLVAAVAIAMSLFQHGLAWMQSWPMEGRVFQLLLLAPVLLLTHWVARRFYAHEPSGVPGIHHLMSDHAPQKKFTSGGWAFPLAWLSHAAAASVGREGIALQWGAFIGNQSFFSSYFSKEQALLLGTGAGFSAMFGTPLAGLVFVVEVFATRKPSWIFLMSLGFSCVLAAWISDVLQVQHMVFPTLHLQELSWTHLWAFTAVLTGAVLGTSLFKSGQKHLAAFFNRLFNRAIQAVWWVGLALTGIMLWPFLFPYQGLGTEGMMAFYTTSAPWFAFLVKGGLTMVCLAVGFKGGEATPLFFMGAAWGSFMASAFSLDAAWPAALGTTLFFSMAFNAPFACAILAASWFGWPVFPIFLLAHLLAKWVTKKEFI